MLYEIREQRVTLNIICKANANLTTSSDIRPCLLVSSSSSLFLLFLFLLFLFLPSSLIHGLPGHFCTVIKQWLAAQTQNVTEFYLSTMQDFHVFPKCLLEHLSRTGQSLTFCSLCTDSSSCLTENFNQSSFLLFMNTSHNCE